MHTKVDKTKRIRELNDAFRRTFTGGQVMLNFSSRGDLDALHRMAEDAGRELRVLRTRTVREGTEDIVYRLISVLASGLPGTIATASDSSRFSASSRISSCKPAWRCFASGP